MGNRDWAQSIAEELGYYLDFVSFFFFYIPLYFK